MKHVVLFRLGGFAKIDLFKFFLFSINESTRFVFEGNDAGNQSERKISHITLRLQLDGEGKKKTTKRSMP